MKPAASSMSASSDSAPTPAEPAQAPVAADTKVPPAASQVPSELVQELETIDPKFPELAEAEKAVLDECRRLLEEGQ